MQTINMTINVYNKEYVEEKVEKFNKVAKRLSKELITLAFENERIEETQIKNEDGVEFTKVEELIDFTIEIKEELKIGDYEIIAQIDHTYPEKNFVKGYIPLDDDYIKELEKVDCNCHHCNSKRRRNLTYIVESISDKNRLQVGRTCLNDYIGHDILKSINYFDLLQELEFDIKNFNSANESREELFLNIKNVLNLVDKHIAKHGYTSKKTEYETGCPSTSREMAMMIQSIYATGKQLEESDKDYQEVIDTILNYETEEGYYLSLKNILRHNFCKMKHVPILATTFIAFGMIKKAMEKEEEKTISEYVGTVGDKIETELTLAHRFGYETIYGYMSIYLFKDASGNIYKWSTKTGIEIEVGETKKIKATIKAHEEYKEEKQTVILRVKVIE